MCNGCKYHSYLSASCWIQSTIFRMPELDLQSLDSKLVCWDMQMDRRFICLGDYCTPMDLMENMMLDLFRPLSRNGATAVKWSSIESICRVSTFPHNLNSYFWMHVCFSYQNHSNFSFERKVSPQTFSWTQHVYKYLSWTVELEIYGHSDLYLTFQLALWGFFLLNSCFSVLGFYFYFKHRHLCIVLSEFPLLKCY